MGIACSDVLVSSSDLRVGLFQQQDPVQSALCLGEGSPDLVVLVDWKVVVNDYLFGLAVDADVQPIDSMLVVVVAAEDVADVAWMPSDCGQSGEEVGIVLVEADNISNWPLFQQTVLQVPREILQSLPGNLPAISPTADLLVNFELPIHEFLVLLPAFVELIIVG